MTGSFAINSERTVLAVFAHPDDEVLCAGGTLALCAAVGRPVMLVCATRGEWGPIAKTSRATRETLGSVRERELRSSCAALGVDRMELLELPDAGVAWAARERNTLREVVHLIRKLRPRTLITFGPDGLYGHTDHVAIGELTSAARKAAADSAFIVGRSPELPAYHVPRLFFPVWTQGFVRELLATLELSGLPAKIWSLQPHDFFLRDDSITASIDVRAALERKLTAIRCYETQFDDDHPFKLLASYPASYEAARGQRLSEIRNRFLGFEHFRCADGLSGGPISA